MLEAFFKSVIFLILLALGGYFFVLFRKKGWFFPQQIGKENINRDNLCVTERLSIGGRHYIAVIQCNEQKFLVGISPSSITSLGKLYPNLHKDHTATQKNGSSMFFRENLSTKNRDIPAKEVIPHR
ncbi:MAG: flagellar biosynthetic protein FliO [Puniceicoccales bacterium]|jgi:flagellar biogenesis protein FliO|nr:flagellar biosynthetic protein FliO [Puniceicoccales bacterium]